MPSTIATGLLLGTVLGFVMQRGRFCVTGMIRDIFTLKTWRGLTALFIVIAVHAVGLAALTTIGVIAPETSDFAPLAVGIGGFIFGLGIILAGGCASGTWYRSGEGLVGSWLALVMYGLSAAAMKAGSLEGLNNALADRTIGATTIHGSLGISIWWFVIPFAAFTAFLAARFLREEAAQPRMANLNQRKKGLAHLFAEKPWHFYSTAVIVGLLGVLAWPLSDATGRNNGLGITTPSSDTFRYLTTGDSERVNWGTLLVIGILVGSFIAAKASGEFRVRVPSPKQAQRSVIGGVMMGVGASWAGGCTVGNGMVETSLFTYQGWFALLAMALGVGVAAKFFLKPTAPAAPITLNTLGGNLIGNNNAPKTGLASVKEGVYRMDTLGAVCPFPLIDAKDAIQQLNSGETLVIDFDCTQATDAIPRWAATDGHEVTNFEATGEAGWTISVKKG